MIKKFDEYSINENFNEEELQTYYKNQYPFMYIDKKTGKEGCILEIDFPKRQVSILSSGKWVFPKSFDEIIIKQYMVTADGEAIYKEINF